METDIEASKRDQMKLFHGEMEPIQHLHKQKPKFQLHCGKPGINQLNSPVALMLWDQRDIELFLLTQKPCVEMKKYRSLCCYALFCYQTVDKIVMQVLIRTPCGRLVYNKNSTCMKQQKVFTLSNEFKNIFGSHHCIKPRVHQNWILKTVFLYIDNSMETLNNVGSTFLTWVFMKYWILLIFYIQSVYF